MKSSTRLDSAVFQLTPTRTRCDLLISANGKMEKIASGLLNPFLAHLKTAQEQMAKGGYSIILEPEPGSDATWFTKGTVERFVRFVSTPEVLERVYTVETEILQMEEAIAIQSNNDIGLSAVEDHQTKPVESIEGSKPLLDPSEEKAIVLYKPGSHPPGVNGSTVQEGDSKVQLLKVLETRKTVLQKEQGMAFARAAAAGFDIDHMAPLMSFSESFGATRLMDACVRFMDLWKRKHETGQWLEIEAAEARSDFSAMNASGIVLANVVNKQNGSREVCPDTPENNGKASIHTSIDEKASTDHQPTGNPEYFQGQFPHPMFPHWPVHSPPGSLPVFQGYPVQGMPYYPGSPFFSPPYQAVEDRRLSAGQRMGHKRHSMDSKDAESESWEMEKARSGDDVEVGKETSHSQEQQKKSSRSGRKQSGMVVIRNLNYITSKKRNSSNSDSRSTSGSGTDEEDENLTGSSPKIKYKNSLRSSKGKEGHAKSIDTLNSFDKEGTADGTDADGAQWQVFQNFLLRDADEEEHAANQGMFAMEKEVRGKRRQHAVYDDPLAYGKNVSQYQEENMTDTQKFSGNTTRLLKGSNDESLISRKIGQSSDGRLFMDGQLDVHSAERDGRRIMYRRSANDAFVIHKRENQADFTNSSDPLAVNGFESASNGLDKRSSNNIDDDSYIVSLRSVSLDEVGVIGRNAIDMDSEFPSSQQKAENISSRVGGQFNYEANDLSLMPERGTENKPIGYDPALDYEMQAHAGDGASLDKRNKEVVSDIKQGSKKSEKDRKSKLTSDASDKKKILGPTRKGRPSKLSALDEAKARAERLRNFKADIQKMKKEKEEVDRRRLEALKIARQKRIAARGNSVNAQSPLSSQQTKKQLPTKLSPSFHKGSKFSDSEPGSSSPLQRFPMRTASLGSTDSHKPSKSSKSNTGSHSTGNRLSRSVSALPEPKKERSRMSDTKASMSRIRRLSEPKIASGAVSSVRARSNELSSKPKISYESQSKKLSAIVNYDKGKAASLPELKIRTSQGPSGKSAAKEMMLKVNENEASTAELELNRNKDKKSHQSDGDDSTVIEKTVVMLECEKPSIPAPQTSDENMGLEKGYCDNHATGAKSGIVSDYSNIDPPIPPKGVDRETSEPNLQGQLNAHDTGLVKVELVSNMVKASPRFSSQTEKPYQAPYARLSSLEDPCTGNSEYVKAPPASIQTNTVEQETVKALISDSKSLKLEKAPEALDKRQIKESSKGLRKLLKFGRKTHSSGTNEHSVESDNVSINGTEADELVGNAAASSEVHTLKNLISQDETPAATPQKTSRHFSLLSPFRSKSSEKKLAS